MQEFLKDSSTLKLAAFFRKLAHIAGKTERIFTKILAQT